MNENVLEALKSVKVALLDADGTFYDGYESRANIGDRVAIVKRRHFHDGQGLSFMRAVEIRILFVSGDGSEILQSHVDKFNDLPSCKSGEWAKIEFCSKVAGQGKIDAINEWLKKLEVNWNECIYVGDDVNDLKAMAKVQEEGGIVFAPANATRRVKEIADYVLEKSGGHGAIRELSELILDAHGVDESTLSPS